MKKLSLLFTLIFAVSAIYYFCCKDCSKQSCCSKDTDSTFTNLVIRNLSEDTASDSVKVYVTLQAPNSVLGMFGIKDTINASKGYFWAKKNVSYYSNYSDTLLGVVISFGGDNLPCQVAVNNGFPYGINVFECSINTAYEVFDISCEDGVNSILRTTVSDTINWATGQGDYVKTFVSAENTFPIEKNLNVRGVFPYRCTDCVDLGSSIPQNCFNLKDTCNTQKVCQVARTNHIGGTIFIDYISPALVPAKQ